MTTPHPRRRRKADDRIIVPGASDHAGMIRCDMILAPLDRLHSALDDKWGIDRLPGILPVTPPAHVPPESHEGYRSILSRYGELVEALNKALDDNDVAGVQSVTPRVMRALEIMDAHCTAAGLASPVAIHEVEYEGQTIGLIADAADWKRAEALRPGVAIYTFADAASALLNKAGGLALLGEAQRLFPGADVVARPPTRGKFAEIDTIPF